ncbi:MAG: cytochrome c [Nitrospinae bacterium]|nr:cytochrome c [Nitrospinota bacterium]
MNKGKKLLLLILFFVISISLDSFISVTKTFAAKLSQDELERLKKEGDQKDEVVERTREEFGREADEANVETFDTVTKKTGSGKSTYGVEGYDYLTGIGKTQSTVSGTEAAKDNPLVGLIDKRFVTKWKAAKPGESKSGWAKETGVTEVWNRKRVKTKIGANYDDWVNQWSTPTRPKETSTGETPIPGADPQSGAHWFSFYCIHCHGWNGKGDGPTAAMLDPRPRNQSNGKYMNNISNLDLFSVIKGGGVARNLSECMPQWGNVLQDQDIWNVIAFLRTIATPKFDPKSEENAVTAANAKDSSEFKELNEGLELEGVMAGRGAGSVGGFSTPGGGRLKSSSVGISRKGSAKEDWAGDSDLEHRQSLMEGFK